MLLSTWFAAAVKANAVSPFESMEDIENSKQIYYVDTTPKDPNVVLAKAFYEAAQFYWDKVKNQPSRFTNPLVYVFANGFFRDLGC